MAVLLQMLDFFRTLFCILAMKTSDPSLGKDVSVKQVTKGRGREWKAANYIH